MSRLASIFACAGVAAAVAAAPAATAPSATQVIRPGVAIGKVRLGMSFAQVRRALGRPQLVNRREERGFGRRYVEYLWNYGDWRIGLAGLRGRERVVRIATQRRSERTREGIGVGSTIPQLARRYRNSARCVSTSYDAPDAGTWIVLHGPGSRMTAFWLDGQTVGYGPRKPAIVGEVMVQFAWFRPVARCAFDWTRG
jgi:hypothetical protein